MKDDFTAANEMVDRMEEYWGNYEFELIYPVISQLRMRMAKYQNNTQFNHIYFNGKLTALKGCVDDILAPTEERLWRFSDAYKYIHEYLWRLRYGLGLMKNSLS
jgi:hypothetical protein